MKRLHSLGWVLLLFPTLGVLLGFGFLFIHSIYPERAAFIRFKMEGTNQNGNYEHFHNLGEQVIKRLLADGRLISANDLPENKARWGGHPNRWPLYGIKGLEFEETAVHGEFISHDYWITINCKTTERYSKKIRDLKALVSSAIGDETMKSVEVTTEIESPSINMRP